MCISGCKNPFSDSKKSDIQHAYVPITERVEEKALRSKTSKSVFNLVHTVESAVQAVEQYIQIPDTERSLTGMDLEDIGKYLPADISTLKRRVKTGNGRSLTGNATETETTISLQDEIDTLIEDYNEELISLVPSLENVALPDGVTVQDGLIYLSEDETVAQHSIEGIAMAEHFLAVANGEDGTEAAKRITAEIESLFEDTFSEDDRALYIKPFSFGRTAQ